VSAKKAEAEKSPKRDARADTAEPISKERSKKKSGKPGAIDMESYRVEVGHAHDIKPANIVGAIANEAGLEAKYIGRIEIFEDHSLLELPAGMPVEVFEQLKTVAIGPHKLRLSRSDLAPLPQKPLDQRVTLSATRSGAERRVAGKARKDGTFSKGAKQGNDGAGKAKKAHRKGGA
jgi:ATP-dependent RNA helicase DeaD